MIPFIVTLVIFLSIIGILSVLLSFELGLHVVIFVFLLCILLLANTDSTPKVKSKHRLVPTITVVCENNKCDTSYTYKEK